MKNKNKKLIIIIIVLIVLMALQLIYFAINNSKKKNIDNNKEVVKPINDEKVIKENINKVKNNLMEIQNIDEIFNTYVYKTGNTVNRNPLKLQHFLENITKLMNNDFILIYNKTKQEKNFEVSSFYNNHKKEINDMNIYSLADFESIYKQFDLAFNNRINTLTKGIAHKDTVKVDNNNVFIDIDIYYVDGSKVSMMVKVVKDVGVIPNIEYKKIPGTMDLKEVYQGPVSEKEIHEIVNEINNKLPEIKENTSMKPRIDRKNYYYKEAKNLQKLGFYDLKDFYLFVVNLNDNSWPKMKKNLENAKTIIDYKSAKKVSNEYTEIDITDEIGVDGQLDFKFYLINTNDNTKPRIMVKGVSEKGEEIVKTFGYSKGLYDNKGSENEQR